MEMKRRDFLKGVACGGLLLAADVPSALAQPFARQQKAMPPEAVGILYDATLCIGCKACVAACKEHNSMPPDFSTTDQLWDNAIDLSGKTLNIIKLYTHGAGAAKDREDGFSFVKRQCMHCIDPSCVSACPVSALTKDPKSGIVSYNKGACLGCRYCQVACPYNIPKFEWDAPFPQIRKCQLCSHRIKEGGYAACCEFCPTGASLFGTTKDLLEEARYRLTLKPGEEYGFPVGRIGSRETSHRTVEAVYQPRIYGEKEGGGTQVLMLAGVPFDKLGMPKLSETSDAARSEGLQHMIYRGMIAPIALLGGLLYAVHRSTKNNDDR